MFRLNQVFVTVVGLVNPSLCFDAEEVCSLKRRIAKLESERESTYYGMACRDLADELRDAREGLEDMPLAAKVLALF